MRNDSSIAKVRNKLSPIVTYFSFLKMLDNNEVGPDKIEKFKKMVKKICELIQNENMEELLLLIKDDKIW
jgi:site-specific recombinase XerD